MSDFYLKFADKVEADSALYTTTPVLAVVDTEGNVITPAGEPIVTPKFANIDVIGTIYQSTPIDAPEDYVPVAYDGYHVNVRVVDGEDASTLTQYSVVPTKPRRVWG